MRAITAVSSSNEAERYGISARILSLNPAIYEDIQFGNPYVGEMLDRLLLQLQELRGLVAQLLQLQQ
ncbi:hypothetical protein XarbCFBP8152_20920 [Xanthomonas arboricola]|nr:hypothetical protein XarbCFBP8152_20920 [Xanthomonas arboricola]